MYKITIQGLLDDGTPVDEYSLCFDAKYKFNEVTSKLIAYVQELVPKPKVKIEYEKVDL